jgi:hypothetical protein
MCSSSNPSNPPLFSDADRAALAGTYFSEELGVALYLAVEEGNLNLGFTRVPGAN